MRNPEPVIALEDIAKRLGIAVSTVSRALRGMPGIHPATRAKVVSEANAMGYIPPRKKSDEVPAQPQNILMLTSGATGTPSGYLAGMSQSAVPFNFSLLSHVTTQAEALNILNPNYQPPSLRMGLVNGIVLIYRWPDEVVEALSRKYPTVSIVEQYPNLPIDVIGIDHIGGMFALVQNLKQSGHKRIGFLGLRTDTSWVRSRFAAYMEALLAHELPFHFEDTVSLTNERAAFSVQAKDDEAIEKAIKKVEQGVRAWICASDTVGNALCASLLQHGFRVPEDVALTGFHRRPSAMANLPLLTTTEVRDELVGEAALRRLAYRLDHQDETPRLILLPCKFLQGKTTAAISEK
ncbi:MAG: LacI family DNA-binding transcriptional regulator [Chthoniobacteraceae bacterium]